MKSRHENVVMFMGACTTPPNFAIVTEWCAGSTLYNAIHVSDRELFIEDKIRIAFFTSR
eukprot:Pgem_evm1s14457